ncbi:copper chaperone, partial [Turicibacter sanguinis]|nr:copper chaperone [Turicibacter sanguinis]
MVKTFMINVENLKTDEDVKKIESYFETNLDGVEKLDINLSLKL